MRKRKASEIPETPEHREARLARQRVRQSEWRAVKRAERAQEECDRKERLARGEVVRKETVEERIARNKGRWRLLRVIEDDNDLILTDTQRLARRYVKRKIEAVEAGVTEMPSCFPLLGEAEDDGEIWGGEPGRVIRWPLMCRDELLAVGASKSYGPETWERTPLPMCPELIAEGRDAGKPCRSPAGTRTWHEGVGSCARHGGNQGRTRVEGAWMMAHGFAKEMNVTPWEALLMAVRIAAGKVMFSQEMIASAVHNLELEGRVIRGETAGNGIPILLDPDTGEPLGVGKFRDLSFWVTQVDRWHERLMRCSKLAIDSGVAEQLVRNQTLEVQLMARAVEAGIQAAGLTADQELAVRAGMRRELLAIESEKLVKVKIEENAIVGSWDENPDGRVDE
jgi:hypothetical protein